MRRRWWEALRERARAVTVALSVLVGARHAGAAEDIFPPLPSVVWEAPRECPDSDAVSARLRDVLDGELLAFGRGWQIRGRVTADGARPWQLVLELRGPDNDQNEAPRQRVLRAKNCDDLAEAAAVAIAIALGDAMSPGRVHDAGNGPGPSESPVTSRSVAIDTMARDGASAPERDAQGANPNPDPNARQAPPALDLSLGGVLDSASVAGWALGIGADARGWLGDIGLGLYGLWLPPHERVIAPQQSADFSLLAAGARGCYALIGNAQRVRVAACAGLELGRFDADSQGLIASTRVHDLWLAPSLGLDVQGRVLGPLTLSSRIDVLWPLERQEYRVDLVQPVHDIPALTVRWTVAIGGDLAAR